MWRGKENNEKREENNNEKRKGDHCEEEGISGKKR